jgi:glycerol-3-phosphate O-acyltransferase
MVRRVIGAHPAVQAPPVPEAGWPAKADARTIVLEFASTATEREVLDGWLSGARPPGADVRVMNAEDPRLEAALAADGDPLVAPVRVAWLPRERGGTRAAMLRDVLAFRNPRRPSESAQRRIVRREPDRCHVLVAAPATASEMRARFERAGADGELCDYVTRQAVLALDRAERRLIGTQYKVPRFVSEEIAASGRFRSAVAALAEREQRPEREVAAEAADSIDEMVASQSRLAIDVWGDFGRWLARAYTIDIDRTGLERLQELNREYPLVFLPSHRSYLDPVVLRSAMHEQGFPPNHVLGGINVGFWPIGPVARRSGYVFIRRSFKDNEVYKLALRQYLAYLLSKRFNLEWYIEGGRSRTGKLRPPRYGLLAYLVEAFRDGGSEDALLVPVSIVYDLLYEVGAMAAEERGAKKTPEGIGWLVGYARAQGKRRGTVYVRVGEPLSLREALAEESAPGARRRNEVEKVAFEVCYRIGRATPVTPTSLVTLALLGVEDRALTLAEIRGVLDPLLDYVERRELPTTGGDLDLRTGDGLNRTLEALTKSGVVRQFADGLEPVYGIRPERHLEAAFYRNSAVHFFINRAITELILARAAEGPSPRLRDEAWEQALRLRDLLKFDFFFAGKQDFSKEIRAELAMLDPDWEQRPAEPESARELLEGTHPHLAHAVLRPFLEAYEIVAERLAAKDPELPIDDKAFLAECAGVARQYVLQKRLRSPESISRELFGSAMRLAANRDLLHPGGADLSERRRAFAEEVRAEVRRVAVVRDLARSEAEPEVAAR